ncbi:hypothetical protein D3C86_1888880 [compost metagenome]
MLKLIQPDAVAEHFQKTRLSPDDGVQPLLINACQIAGSQTPLALITFDQVFTAGRVTERHILTVINQLTALSRCGDFSSGLIFERKSATGDRPSHHAGIIHRQRRGQKTHPRGGFRCAVHDEKA